MRSKRFHEENKLDRYDLDWAHRHYRQNPIFLHKSLPKEAQKSSYKLDYDFSIKPSVALQQHHIRGKNIYNIFPKSKEFDMNYQLPMTHSAGYHQNFVYEEPLTMKGDMNKTKWREDFQSSKIFC